MIGRIKRPSVNTPARGDGPSASASDAERPDEQRQAEDAVDDRRHPRQVGDVGLDHPLEPARRGVFFEEDPGADPHRDPEQGHQPQQPEAPRQPDAEPRDRRVARLPVA